MSSKNLRTITDLDQHNINSISDILSDDIYFEISKRDGSDTIITQKISSSQFINTLSAAIMQSVSAQFVTLTTDQTISGEKTFTNKMILSSNNDNNSLLSCNSPIDGIAMSAWWA